MVDFSGNGEIHQKPPKCSTVKVLRKAAHRDWAKMPFAYRGSVLPDCLKIYTMHWLHTDVVAVESRSIGKKALLVDFLWIFKFDRMLVGDPVVTPFTRPGIFKFVSVVQLKFKQILYNFVSQRMCYKRFLKSATLMIWIPRHGLQKMLQGEVSRLRRAESEPRACSW